MEKMDFIHSGDKDSYRIDLLKVESFRRDYTCWREGNFGFGPWHYAYFIKFRTSSGEVKWRFTSETERDKVFARLEKRVTSKAL